MNVFILDTNAFDKLLKDIDLIERLRVLIAEGQLVVKITQCILCEINHDNNPYKDEENELIEVLGIDVIGIASVFGVATLPLRFGPENKEFAEHKGNKKNPRRMKDSEVYAAVKQSNAILITDNLEDFKKLGKGSVVSFDDFNDYIIARTVEASK